MEFRYSVVVGTHNYLSYASRTVAAADRTVSNRTERQTYYVHAVFSCRNAVMNCLIKAFNKMSKLYADSVCGHPPVPPAQLAWPQ